MFEQVLLVNDTKIQKFRDKKGNNIINNDKLLLVFFEKQSKSSVVKKKNIMMKLVTLKRLIRFLSWMEKIDKIKEKVTTQPLK